MALACFEASGEDDQDPQYVALTNMQKPFMQIVGIPLDQ
jgi:hypothetical protein